ncbi:MAG: protein kinase [Planctomycetota bacterium]|nr:protein kinase [Planctomycetota bacterium]MDA1249315.1 protein kinase [Planctomycetota bacterium]
MPSYRYDHGERPLEGYTIEHALGRGGFGEVYYALSDSGRQVALKAVQNYEDIELRGISHCMNLKSPHLVSIFDVRHNDRGDAFVIMEYVAGPSLRELLDESPEGLGVEKAAWFVREMAKGLALLHDAGVVHRDLKPHNVFVEDGYVKVGDYSLSKIMSASHRSGHTMTVGSVHYMAPEISLGRYDKTVDIYALGVMLYEMLTGRPPFVGETMGEVLMKHMAGDVDVSGIEEPFASVVLKAMAHAPEDRYQSVDEMVEALFGVEHISNSVSGFNPQSLTVLAGRAAQMAHDRAAGASHGAERPKVDRYSPQPARPAAAMSEPATSTHFFLHFLEVFYHALFIKTYPRTVFDRKIEDVIPFHFRAVLSIGVGITGVLTVSLITRNANHVAYFVFMTLSMVGITTLVSKFITRRLPDAPAWFHRIAYLPLMGIAALVVNENAGHIRGNDEFSWAVLFPLMLMDWRWLTSPVRPGRVMLLPTVFAGAVAGVAGVTLTGDEFPIAGAVCAVAALMVQVLCPFDPKASEELAATSDWIDTLNSVFVARREEVQRRRRASTKLAERLRRRPVRSEQPAGVAPSVDAADLLAGSSSITLETPAGSSASASAETIGLSGARIESAESAYDSRDGSEPSSRLTALALAMLPFCSVGVLPFFGLHRFYVGKKVTGVLWLLTLGICGIGQLIDALMIALGGFKDPQGRHLVTPLAAGTGDQKVNPLSTLPSPESLIHTGMNLLGGLLLAFVIPMGFLLALDLPAMIDADVFREIGLDPRNFKSFFDDTRWTGHLWNMIATALCVLGLTSLTLIALARRHCGFIHLFRVPLAGAALMGAFAVVMETTWGFRWQEFGTAINDGQFGRILSLVFHENMFPAMVFGPVLISVGLVVLSWPPRFRNLVATSGPYRPIPQVAGQTPAEQEVS